MHDHFGRPIDYLRISITEACNFRCLYCAPDGYAAPSASALTVDHIRQIVTAAANLGITKIRLTGGEPLVRPDVVKVTRAIAATPGIVDLSLTTNGFLLEGLARPLVAAGLRRINISLDSLHPDRFARIVGRAAFDQVWGGIQAADATGLNPLKLNVVAMRGINDDEVEDFARLTAERGWHVRFIELMPVGTGEAAREFFEQHFVPAREFRQRLPELEPASARNGNGPARLFRLPGARGTIGFITPTSEHFCAECNRIRVTARGRAHACLFGNCSVDVLDALQEGGAAVQRALEHAITNKPERHPLTGDVIPAGAMSEIGG